MTPSPWRPPKQLGWKASRGQAALVACSWERWSFGHRWSLLVFQNPSRIFYCFLLREALGLTFSETVFVPGVRGRAKSYNLSQLPAAAPPHPTTGNTCSQYVGIFACQKKKKTGRHGTLLGVSGPSVLNGAELGVFQDNCPSCLKKPLEWVVYKCHLLFPFKQSY